MQSILHSFTKFQSNKQQSFSQSAQIMSKPTLYVMAGSPPANAVLLLIKHLGLDVEVKHVDFLKGEHKTPEYLKLNPAHEVPVLVDGDFVLTESRAILSYLVNSRKAGSDLYPTDPKKRARVDQRLNYDQIVFVKLATFTRPIMMIGAEGFNPKVRDSLIETVNIVDKTLENSKWIAGDNLTIADFSLATSIAGMVTLGYDLSKHANLARWYKQVEGFKGFEDTIKGAQTVEKYLKAKFSEPIF